MKPLISIKRYQRPAFLYLRYRLRTRIENHFGKQRCRALHLRREYPDYLLLRAGGGCGGALVAAEGRLFRGRQRDETLAKALWCRSPDPLRSASTGAPRIHLYRFDAYSPLRLFQAEQEIKPAVLTHQAKCPRHRQRRQESEHEFHVMDPRRRAIRLLKN